MHVPHASPAAERLARYVEAEVPRRSGLRVREVAWVGATQVALATRYELRGVRVRLTPATRRAPSTPRPDPWSIDLRDDVDAAPPGEVARRLPGGAVHVDCFVCRASGEGLCLACAGTGMSIAGADDDVVTAACGGCRGSGRCRCPECHGSGGLDGEATVWSRIGVHEETRSIRGRALPSDVVAALTLASQRGDVLHRLEGRRLDEIVLPVGYRDAPAEAEALLETARNLCAAPGLEPGARVLHQVLEVRRVPVAHLHMEDGSEIWCWGEPPAQWPASSRVPRRLGGASWAALLACAALGALAVLASR